MEINEIILSIFLNLAKYQFWLSKSHFKIGKNLNSEFDIFKYFSRFYYFFINNCTMCTFKSSFERGSEIFEVFGTCTETKSSSTTFQNSGHTFF